MIALSEACEIIAQKYPKMRILKCFDNDSAYVFSLVNRRWNGNPEDVPAGSTLYDVMKTDGSVYLDDCIDSVYPPGYELTEVFEYMSEEDSSFSKKANRKLKEFWN